MRKFSVTFVVVVFLASFAFSQAEKSAKKLPPKTKLYPGLSLDNRPPSSTITSPANVKIPKTSAPLTALTKTKTPSPALATGFMVKEQQQEVSDWAYFYVFVTLGVLVTATIVILIIFGNHRRERDFIRRQKVIENRKKIESLPAGYFPSVMAKIREEEQSSVAGDVAEEKKEDEASKNLATLKVDPSRWNDISTY